MSLTENAHTFRKSISHFCLDPEPDLRYSLFLTIVRKNQFINFEVCRMLTVQGRSRLVELLGHPDTTLNNRHMGFEIALV